MKSPLSVGESSLPFAESNAEENADRLNEIPPADLFPLLESTRCKGDRHFDDSMATLEYLGGHLGAELKPLAAQGNALDNLTPERFVGCGLIGDPASEQKADQLGQDPICHTVWQPHVPDFSQESRAVRYVRLASDDGLYHGGDLVGVVLQVGVLNDGYIAGEVLETRSDRGAFPAIPIMPEHDGVGVPLLLFENRGGSVL